MLLVLVTFRDYGIPSDEQAWDGYGALLLNYYRTGGGDLHAINYWNWHWYGGLFHLVNAWVASQVTMPPHEVSHLLVAITGLLGIAGCWRIGHRVSGPRAGLLGASLLTLTPLYFGQMFTNAKDVPFAAAYIWAVAAVIEAAGDFPDMSRGRAVRIGLLTGLALGIRVGGILVLGYLGLAILAYGLLSGPRGRITRVKPLIARGAIVAVVAYVVMLACWPYAQHSPVTGPWHALRMFAHFDQDLPMRFAGRTVFSDALPRWYAPWYLAVCLPEPVLLLLAAAIVQAWRARRLAIPVVLRYGVLLAAAVLPVLLVTAMRSTLYNGIRHLIFILPPLAVVAGLALDRLIPQVSRRQRTAAFGLAGLWLIWHLGLMVRLHPYEYVYANGLTGGIRHASAGYEMDYWGESLKDAAGQLAAYVRDHPPRPARVARVFVCPNAYSARPFLSPQLITTDQRTDADYVLATICSTCPGSAGREVARVDRCGVTLTRVLATRSESERGTEKAAR